MQHQVLQARQGNAVQVNSDGIELLLSSNLSSKLFKRITFFPAMKQSRREVFLSVFDFSPVLQKMWVIQ